MDSSRAAQETFGFRAELKLRNLLSGQLQVNRDEEGRSSVAFAYAWPASRNNHGKGLPAYLAATLSTKLPKGTLPP